MRDCSKRIYLSIFWIIVGAALFAAGFFEKIDSFWSGMGGALIGVGIVETIRWARYRNDPEYKAGIHTVIIPEENLPDLEEVDETVREHVTFVPAKTLDTVLNTALVPAEPAAEAQTATAELCHV